MFQFYIKTFTLLSLMSTWQLKAIKGVKIEPRKGDNRLLCMFGVNWFPIWSPLNAKKKAIAKIKTF